MIDTLLLIQSYSHPSFWYAQIINFCRCCVSSSSHFSVILFTSSSNAKQDKTTLALPSVPRSQSDRTHCRPRGATLLFLSTLLGNVNKSSSPFSFATRPHHLKVLCFAPKTAFLSLTPLPFVFARSTTQLLLSTVKRSV